MSRRPTVPYDVLALTYLRAVEQGRPPAKALREECGLSRKGAEWRREWMGQTGWLPPGDPVRDGRLQGRYDAAWQAQARAMVAAKLKDRMAWATQREREAARKAQDAVLRAGRQQAAARAAQAAQQAARTPQARVQRGRGPVMDVFV